MRHTPPSSPVPAILRLLLPLLLVFAAGCRDQFLLYPTRNALQVEGNAQRRMIPWKEGNLELFTSRSAACANQPPQAYLLRFIGAGDRAEKVAYQMALWKELPVEAWTVNRPGFGESDGTASADLMGPAALVAYDALAKEANGKPILVWGYSIGGSEALYVASQRPVAGVILRNTPPIKQLLVDVHGWWNLWLISGPAAATLPPELDTLKCASECKAPAVFIMSDGDFIVPHQMQADVYDAYAGPKHQITDPEGGHSGAIGEDIWNAVKQQLAWLWQTGVTPAASAAR